MHAFLTTLVYHYVRDLEQSDFPRIKGRRTAEFDAQLDYIERHYTVVTLAEVLRAFRDEGELPPAPCLLTFDDGLVDHYETVLPRLVDRSMTGVFYPTARPVYEPIVLDVHKLHFVLAVCANHDVLVGEVAALVAERRRAHRLPSDEELASRYRTRGVYDPPETAYIKRLLQHGLPLRVRGEIVDILFRRHVTADEAAFSRELYMNADQLRDLQGAGMELGGHGVRHEHLGLLPVEQQVRELCGTRAFLKELSGGVLREWSMCFPYGSYNDATLRVAAHLGCALAVSVRPGLTRLPLVDAADPIPVLDRLDTNDLPYKIATGAEDSACDWTRRVGAL